MQKVVGSSPIIRSLSKALGRVLLANGGFGADRYVIDDRNGSRLRIY